MNRDAIRDLLAAVRSGEVPIDEALGRLRFLEAADLGFARVDRQRALRCGFPEVIYCPGKLPVELQAIAREIVAHGGKLLATRASPEQVDALRRELPDAVHHERARAVTVRRGAPARRFGKVVVLTAGSADIPVAEEAVVTAEMMDSAVEPIYDVGVAGMEGALPSVVGGLVDRPVIAVPTSVGYGAALGGIAPLLTMLSSCAAGVAVVNIDNGFGAGYIAGLINNPPARREERGEDSDDAS